METNREVGVAAANAPRDRRAAKITRQRLGWDDLKVLILFLCFVLAIEGIALGLWSWSVNGISGGDAGRALSGWGVFATGMMCSGAASLVGGLIGFLFGIPRSIESNAGRLRISSTTIGASPNAATLGEVPQGGALGVPARSATSRLRVNTNLEDISDGVTKVLLGASLAEARSLVEAGSRLAALLGPSFGPAAAGETVALATIIYGALEGFFAGYLATRLYLTAAFERHDPQKFNEA